MKTPKIFLALLISFFSFQAFSAQEKAEPEPFDAFGELNCESILGRLDNFFYAVKNNPAATGYIIIYGKSDGKTNFFKHEWRVYSNLEFRRFDDSRLIVVRAESDDDALPFTQFYLVQPGEKKPAFVEIKPDLSISENRKPFIFNSTKEDDFPCPNGLQLKIYSDYLAANPAVRGHIVIFAESAAEFEKKKSDISKNLADKYKVSSDRLRFFFVRNRVDSYVELWLVPQKTRG